MIILLSLFHSQGDWGTGRWVTCTARRRQIRDSTRQSKSRTCVSVSYLSWQNLPPWGSIDSLTPDLVFLCFCFFLVLPRSWMETSAPRLRTEPGPQHWKPTVRPLASRELPRGSAFFYLPFILSMAIGICQKLFILRSQTYLTILLTVSFSLNIYVFYWSLVD